MSSTTRQAMNGAAPTVVPVSASTTQPTATEPPTAHQTDAPHEPGVDRAGEEAEDEEREAERTWILR